MTRTRKSLTGLGILAAVVILLGLIGLSLVPKNEELARRAVARLTEFSGVPVSVGALRLQTRTNGRLHLDGTLKPEA